MTVIDWSDYKEEYMLKCYNVYFKDKLVHMTTHKFFESNFSPTYLRVQADYGSWIQDEIPFNIKKDKDFNININIKTDFSVDNPIVMLYDMLKGSISEDFVKFLYKLAEYCEQELDKGD